MKIFLNRRMMVLMSEQEQSLTVWGWLLGGLVFFGPVLALLYLSVR